MKERYLIIDGYNMIGQSSALSAIAKESLEEARAVSYTHLTLPTKRIV